MRRVDLVEEAARMRQALETLAPKMALFESFPVGTCGNTTELLGQWLTQRKVVGLENVYGEAANGITHAWLELDDLIIDITADQFPDGMPKVFVSRDRSFHDRFTVNSRHEHMDNPSVSNAYMAVNTYLREQTVDEYSTKVGLFDAPAIASEPSPLLTYLKAHPDWHSKDAILTATGFPENRWNVAIKELLESGAVERQGEKRGARYRAKEVL